MAEVIAVRKDNQDRIMAFKLDDGRVLDYTQCMMAIDQGELPSLMYIANKVGEMSIKSQSDGDPSNNLSRMPLF